MFREILKWFFYKICCFGMKFSRKWKFWVIWLPKIRISKSSYKERIWKFSYTFSPLSHLSLLIVLSPRLTSAEVSWTRLIPWVARSMSRYHLLDILFDWYWRSVLPNGSQCGFFFYQHCWGYSFVDVDQSYFLTNISQNFFVNIRC